MPSCIGTVPKWKRHVTEMRIANAHGLESEPTRTGSGSGTAKQDSGSDAGDVSAEERAMFDLHALTRSLRWALRIRLLQHCGVTNDAIGEAVSQWQEYLRDERTWRDRWPAIFPSTPATRE